MISAEIWNAILWLEDVKEGITAKRELQSVLHVHFGLVIYLAALLVLRQPWKPWRALAAVLAVQGANELMDYLVKPHFGLSDSFIDSFNTLWWPTVFTVAFALWRPRMPGHVGSGRVTVRAR